MIKIDTSITKSAYDHCNGNLCAAQLCLPAESARKSENCWIHGDSHMQKANFALNRVCKRKFEVVPEFYQFCVEYEKQSVSNSCLGLRGSPIVCEQSGRLVLAGISSKSKCRSSITELHEDIYFSNGWIREVVRNN